MSENDSIPPADTTATDGTVQFAGPPDLVIGKPAAREKSLSSLGPYELGREIGRGAMGTVYEAVHTQLQRTVALKVLPPELAQSPERLQRFRREMAAIGRLDHPNIVLATDAGETNGVCYIAMQFIQGRDLEAILNEFGRFDPADACEMARQTALGLQHIHEQRLVHRDIKPSNILLTERGEIKILDLGIAMLRNLDDRDTSMTAIGSLMGTPDYIAPEQISQTFDVDIRADIYSLGCTLYGLLSGKPPFTGPGYTTFTAKLVGHAERQPPDLRELCPEVPDGVVQIVEQMMAKNPDERPALPIDVVDVLDEFCVGADLMPIASGHIRKRPVSSRSNRNNELEKPGGEFLRSSAILVVASLFIGACMIALILLWGRAESSRDGIVLQANPVVAVASAPTKVSVKTQMAIDPVRQFANSDDQVAENIAHIAATLDKVWSIAKTVSNGVTIENPRTPTDHYFNARIYTMRGDYLKARQSFLAYFADELPVVDPHMQFVQVLKLQEGVAGAREMYRELPGDKHLPARRLVTAMLSPAAQRIDLFEELVNEHPDFAPAWYQLSREYSADRKPRRTLGDQVREKELLSEFMRLHSGGKLLKYFLDQSKASTMLSAAQQRLKALQNVDIAAAKNPVQFSLAMQVGSIWQIGFGIAEAAVEIQYRMGEAGEFKSTGTTGVYTGGAETIDVRTGKPFPKSYIEFPAETPRCTIYVQYIDANLTLCGPYALDFDPDALKAKWQRSQLQISKRDWLHFDTDRLNFSLFHTGRSQIKSVVYGLNEETPKRVKQVPQESINNVNFRDYSVPISPSVQFATIQITYIDGTQSEIVKISRPNRP